MASAVDYAQAEKSEATRRAYASDWRHFCAWCADVVAIPLPASVAAVAAYLAHLADAGTVAAIYHAQYAEAIRFDALPPGIGYCVLDAAVNSGPVQAARWLQRALGVPVDGHIGLMTLDAARAARPAELVDAICDARLGFLRHLPTWIRFGRGWRNRVACVRSHALAMVAPAAA